MEIQNLIDVNFEVIETLRQFDNSIMILNNKKNILSKNKEALILFSKSIFEKLKIEFPKLDINVKFFTEATYPFGECYKFYSDKNECNKNKVLIFIQGINFDGLGEFLDGTEETEAFENFVQEEFNKFFDAESGLSLRVIIDEESEEFDEGK